MPSCLLLRCQLTLTISLDTLLVWVEAASCQSSGPWAVGPRLKVQVLPELELRQVRKQARLVLLVLEPLWKELQVQLEA